MNLRELLNTPGPLMYGPALGEHVAALGRTFGVELLPGCIVPGGKTFVFPLRDFDAFLLIGVEDQGPHPDGDGSRLTGIKPWLAGRASDLARSGFRVTGWDPAIVGPALDAIALFYIDAKECARPGRAC